VFWPGVYSLCRKKTSLISLIDVTIIGRGYQHFSLIIEGILSDYELAQESSTPFSSAPDM
jgi:hypothetical protein